MKRFLKKTACMTMVVVSAMVFMTGCNKKLKVSFDCTASDYVKLGQYKGLEVNVDAKGIADDLLNRRIQSDLDTVTEYKETNKEAKEEDQITVSFTGSVGGENVEGFSSESYSLVLGKDEFTIPGFVDELYGLKTGDTKVVTLKVPDKFAAAEEYQGKRIVFNIAVLIVENPVVPQITDAYAKDNFGYDTLEAYKEGLRAELQETVDEKVNQAKTEAVMKKLYESSEILGYPADIVESKKEEYQASISFYSMSYGMTVDEYCMDRYGLSLEEYAKNAVIQELIIQQIAIEEELYVDEYYYKGELENTAKDNGYSSAASFVEKFGKEKIVKGMLFKKATDIVMDSAVYNN